jgi:hypothetical protein
MSIKSHNVDRKERLMVDIAFKFPSPHNNKAYVDARRHYIMKVDISEAIKIDKEQTISQSLRLRSLVVIKKMFGSKIDSSLTYRVGENFGMLRIGDSTLRVSLSFNEKNEIAVLDNSMHIPASRVLEVITPEKDE